MMAKGKKTGGRSKGTPNKLTRDVQLFVDRVFERIDPLDKIEDLLNAESADVQSRVLLRLFEYRYGKPKESLELNGDVNLREIVQKARERAECKQD